jgi:ABC-type Na+ efflux pump permease subunit
MDYLKSLTTKQWLIAIAVIIFFIASYFIFFRTPSKNEKAAQIENLIQKSTASKTIDENLKKAEIDFLVKQGTVVSSSTQTKKELSKDQKDALLKLLSAPRK